jgi:hypothetical protein
MHRKHTPPKSKPETFTPIAVPWRPRELSDDELLELAVTELENRERRSAIRGALR